MASHGVIVPLLCLLLTSQVQAFQSTNFSETSWVPTARHHQLCPLHGDSASLLNSAPEPAELQRGFHNPPPYPPPSWAARWHNLLMALLHLIRQAYDAATGSSSAASGTSHPEVHSLSSTAQGTHAQADISVAHAASGLLHHAAGVLSHSALVQALAWQHRCHPSTSPSIASSPQTAPEGASPGQCTQDPASASYATGHGLTQEPRTASAQVWKDGILPSASHAPHTSHPLPASNAHDQLQRLLHSALLLERASSMAHRSGSQSSGSTEAAEDRQLASILRALAATLEAPSSQLEAGASVNRQTTPGSGGQRLEEAQDAEAPTCAPPTLQQLLSCMELHSASGSVTDDKGTDGSRSLVALTLLLPGLLWMCNALRALATLPRDAFTGRTSATHTALQAPRFGQTSADSDQQQQQQQASAWPHLPFSVWQPDAGCLAASTDPARAEAAADAAASAQPLVSSVPADQAQQQQQAVYQAEQGASAPVATQMVQMQAVRAVQAGLVVAQYQDQVLRLEAGHREDLARLHSKCRTQLRLLQQGPAADTCSDAHPNSAAAYNTVDADVHSTLDQGPVGRSRQRDDAEHSYMIATGGMGEGVERSRAQMADHAAGRSPGADAGAACSDGVVEEPLAPGVDLLLGSANSGLGTDMKVSGSSPGRSGRPDAGSLSRADGEPGCGRAAGRFLGFTAQLTAAAAMAASLRRKAEGQARTWERLRTALPQQGEPVGTATGATMAVGTATEGACAASQPSPLPLPLSPLGKHTLPGTPGATRAVLQQLQERLSSSYRKQIEQLEEEHVRTLQALSQTHHSQVTRLTSQLQEQQHETQALKRMLAAGAAA